MPPEPARGDRTSPGSPTRVAMEVGQERVSGRVATDQPPEAVREWLGGRLHQAAGPHQPAELPQLPAGRRQAWTLHSCRNQSLGPLTQLPAEPPPGPE